MRSRAADYRAATAIMLLSVSILQKYSLSSWLVAVDKPSAYVHEVGTQVPLRSEEHDTIVVSRNDRVTCE